MIALFYVVFYFLYRSSVVMTGLELKTRMVTIQSDHTPCLLASILPTFLTQLLQQSYLTCPPLMSASTTRYRSNSNLYQALCVLYNQSVFSNSLFHHQVPDHLEPGLNSQLSRLLGLEPESGSPKSKRSQAVELLSNSQQRAAKLEAQSADSKYHDLAGGRLILKQGLVNKRKVSIQNINF